MNDRQLYEDIGAIKQYQISHNALHQKLEGQLDGIRVQLQTIDDDISQWKGAQKVHLRIWSSLTGFFGALLALTVKYLLFDRK